MVELMRTLFAETEPKERKRKRFQDETELVKIPTLMNLVMLTGGQLQPVAAQPGSSPSHSFGTRRMAPSNRLRRTQTGIGAQQKRRYRERIA
jgi:hypothetical protein